MSKIELTKTISLITTLYEGLEPNIHPFHRWLFQASKEERLLQPYLVQIAWIDSVRWIYPAQFNSLRNTVGIMDSRPSEVEYIKEHKIGRYGIIQMPSRTLSVSTMTW